MEMIEVKTSELIGGSLNWAVAQAEEMNPFILSGGMYCGTVVAVGNDKTWSPSINWRQGGPLIDKHAISLVAYSTNLNGSPRYWVAEPWSYCPIRIDGDTALIAACRAIVAAKLGDTVSVPKELMQ